MALERFYAVREAAAALRVSEQTIRAWLRSGKLRGSRAGERRRVIRESELQRLIVDDSRRESPKKDRE